MEWLTQAFLAGSGNGNSRKELLKLLLPASASMYLEALSRDIEFILLRLLEKDIFELDLEGCFVNHNCQIRSKIFSALYFSS